MSLSTLYSELSKVNMQYHTLAPLGKGCIKVMAKVMDPEGIVEVMRIKELADKYKLMARWDGKDVLISRT